MFGIANSSSINVLVSGIVQRELRRTGEKYINGSLIDIGCGRKPYLDLLAPYVTEHIGVDHDETIHEKSHIDRFGTAYDIPAEDGEFDSALCTAVLEHLEEPETVLRECFRVLNPGGDSDLLGSLHLASA